MKKTIYVVTIQWAYQGDFGYEIVYISKSKKKSTKQFENTVNKEINKSWITSFRGKDNYAEISYRDYFKAILKSSDKQFTMICLDTYYLDYLQEEY